MKENFCFFVKPLKSVKLLVLASSLTAFSAYAVSNTITPVDTGSYTDITGGGSGGSTPPKTQFCGKPVTLNLLAEQTKNVGQILIANDARGNVLLGYQGKDFVFTETHLAVAKSLAGIPQTKKGNPKIGKFPYSSDYKPPVNTASYTVNPKDLGYKIGDTLYISAHAVVRAVPPVKKKSSSNEYGKEREDGRKYDAWGQGLPFPKKNDDPRKNPREKDDDDMDFEKNIPMYFTYKVQPCEKSPPKTIQTGDFKTYPPEGWIHPCANNNQGCYIKDNFAKAFPDGVYIGMGQNSLLLNDLAAVLAVLPQSTKAGTLSGITNIPAGGTPPSSTTGGALTGQIIALLLNIGFDAYDPNFNGSDVSLKELMVTSGTCTRMNVGAVLDAAQAVISGGQATTPSGQVLDPYLILDCVKAINDNFSYGASQNGYLEIPFTFSNPGGDDVPLN